MKPLFFMPMALFIAACGGGKPLKQLVHASAGEQIVTYHQGMQTITSNNQVASVSLLFDRSAMTANEGAQIMVSIYNIGPEMILFDPDDVSARLQDAEGQALPFTLMKYDEMIKALSPSTLHRIGRVMEAFGTGLSGDTSNKIHFQQKSDREKAARDSAIARIELGAIRMSTILPKTTYEGFFKIGEIKLARGQKANLEILIQNEQYGTHIFSFLVAG